MNNCFEHKNDCRCDECKGKKDHSCKVVCEEKRLCGVKFELRAKCGCIIACGRTNECGELKFDRLPFGCYILTEIESAKGWQCDNKSFFVEICEDKPHKCIEVVNRRDNGSIKIIKIGKEEKFVCEKGRDKDNDRDEDC